MSNLPTNARGTPVPIRRVSTVSERESLKQTAEVYGEVLGAADNFLPGSNGFGAVAMPNSKKVRLNEQQKNVIKVYNDQYPEPTSPEERDMLSKHAEKLKEQFSPFLQTNAELRAHSRRDPIFITALRKGRDWSKPAKELGGRTPQDVAEDYRNIMRRLDPENPEADSLESLRKSR